jgi:hypothetical protein
MNLVTRNLVGNSLLTLNYNNGLKYDQYIQSLTYTNMETMMKTNKNVSEIIILRFKTHSHFIIL